MMEEQNRPLTIAFFVEGMYSSGVDTSTRLLARALRQLGHRVTLFSPWQDHKNSSPGEDAFLLPAVNLNFKQRIHLSYPLSWRLIDEFKGRRYDLIHVHTSTSVNLLAWQVARLFELPVVYTYHTMSKAYLHYYLGPFSKQVSHWLDPMVEFFDKVVCDRAALVLTPSEKAANYLNAIGVTPRVEVIANGVDLDRFHPFPSDFLQTCFNLPSDAKVLLFVGRLNQEKRPLLAYEHFRQLCRQRNDVWLVMVGDGPQRQELAQQALADGLAGRLVLTGLLPYAQMPAVYNAAHLWLSTSQSEVQPMVALEAIACGLPAVVYADPALQGIVEHAVNGFVVGDDEDFLCSLHHLLDTPERYQAMRSAAIRQGEQYSVGRAAARTLRAYHQILSNRRPPLQPVNANRRRRFIGLPKQKRT